MNSHTPLLVATISVQEDATSSKLVDYRLVYARSKEEASFVAEKKYLDALRKDSWSYVGEVAYYFESRSYCNSIPPPVLHSLLHRLMGLEELKMYVEFCGGEKIQ